MNTALSLVIFSLGLFLVGLTLQDAFEVMLLPRHVRRRWRLTRVYFDNTWRAWRWYGCRIPGLRARERFLSLFGPLSMILLFALWVIGLMVGYALLSWSLERGLPKAHAFGNYLYGSGVTLLTLGYGDVLPQTAATKMISVMEAATGFGLLAVVIGYLPVLYQLFSRREVYVIQLDGRAGTPPAAATLLYRHACDGELTKLEELLREWERWCAELVESHVSYPMLSFYRSQHENQSWLSGLTAITDSCAIIMTGLKDVPTFQSKMTFAMTRLAIVDLCRVLGLDPLTDYNDRTRSGGFARLDQVITQAGFQWTVPDQAEASLAEFRQTYEPFLAALSRYLLIDLPLFAPPPGSGGSLDNWQRSAGGRTAKDLVENTPG